MAIVQRLASNVACLALLAAIASSCADAPTEPALDIVHRATAIIVSDSLGTPAGGAVVQVVAQFDSAGIVPVAFATTDASGVASVVLTEGTWGVHAKTNARTVAGCTFTVPGKTQEAPDTVVVRITLHTASVARGRALLPFVTDHRGTTVGCPPAPSVSVTDSSGDYVLDQLPLGHWTITMHRPHFRLGLAEIDITTPGDTLTVPDTHLVLDLP